MAKNNPTESLKQALQAFELALADLNGAIRAQDDRADDHATVNALRDLRAELAGNIVRIRAILADATRLAPTRSSDLRIRFRRPTTQQTVRIERQTMAEIVASANASAGGRR